MTLHQPPSNETASSMVSLTFAWHSRMRVSIDEAGQVLRLRDNQGTTALLYDQLLVFDAQGRTLPAHFVLLPQPPLAESKVGTAHPQQFQIVIDASQAEYPLTVDPLLHLEVAILRASDAQADDEFGKSVSVSGDTVVVGAWGEDNATAGAAYVYERNEGGLTCGVK